MIVLLWILIIKAWIIFQGYDPNPYERWTPHCICPTKLELQKDYNPRVSSSPLLQDKIWWEKPPIWLGSS